MTAQTEDTFVQNKVSNKLFYAEWFSILGVLISCFAFLFYQNQLQTERWVESNTKWAEARVEASKNWAEAKAESDQKWSDLRTESDKKFYEMLKERSKF